MRMRINLLPTKYSRKRAGAMQELITMVVVVLVTLGGLGAWWYMMDTEIAQIKNGTAKIKLQIGKLKKAVVRVNSFKKKARALKDKLVVIDKLKAKKTGPVLLLDDLATTITKVGDVWIESMTEEDGFMVLDMHSLRQDKISEFMQMLEKRSKYFARVKLLISESKSEKNVTYYHFRVKCKVEYAAT